MGWEMRVDIPTLEELLDKYATWVVRLSSIVPLTPSPTTPDELARIQTELHLSLPDDYQALALRFNLAAIEFNFSNFFPPVVRRVGANISLFDAFAILLTSNTYPFSEEYRSWGVAPVAEDNWGNTLVLAVRQPDTPQLGITDQPMYPLTKPYGSVWAFYPDERLPSIRHTFEYVSASFTQTLHVALLCWRVWGERKERRMLDVHIGELRDALTTIDPTTQTASYWQGWINTALEAARPPDM